MSLNSRLFETAIRKAAEAVERAGGTDAVMREVVGALVRYNQQQRSQSPNSSDSRNSDNMQGSTETGAGSLSSILSQYLAASEDGLKHDEEKLRQQGLSEAAIAAIMLQRREAATSEITSLLSNTMASQHQTAMDLFRKLGGV